MSKLKIIEIKIAKKFILNTKKPSITNALPNNKLTIFIKTNAAKTPDNNPKIIPIKPKIKLS